VNFLALGVVTTSKQGEKDGTGVGFTVVLKPDDEKQPVTVFVHATVIIAVPYDCQSMVTTSDPWPTDTDPRLAGLMVQLKVQAGLAGTW
jgi:hypothetical protein